MTNRYDNRVLDYSKAPIVLVSATETPESQDKLRKFGQELRKLRSQAKKLFPDKTTGGASQ